jgi:hypothetical protein
VKDEVITSAKLMAGWGCSICRIYNGAQRETCRGCGKEWDAPPEVKEQVRRLACAEQAGVSEESEPLKHRMINLVAAPHLRFRCPFCTGEVQTEKDAIIHTLPTCRAWEEEPDPVLFLRKARMKMAAGKAGHYS